MAGDLTTDSVTSVFRDLEQGALAVTASRRLARHVAQCYADWKIAAGAEAWPSPSVRVLEDWLAETWQWALAHRPDAPRLLGDQQELLLWEQIIRRCSAESGGRVLLQLAGTARAARRSWQRVQEWRLDWQRLRQYRSADTEAFLVWARAVRAALDEHRWLTAAELPSQIAKHADDCLPARGTPLWWMGFDVVPPALEHLMTLMAERGIEQRRFDNAGMAVADPVLVECGDMEEEWHRIARWARAELEAEPRRSLGVVCPDLGRHRDRIEEILEDVLHPDSAWHPESARSFHLSLGRALPDYPVISGALDLLRCAQRRAPFDVVSRLLRSPYLSGAQEEWAARARFEVALRRRQQETYSLEGLARLAQRHGGLGHLKTMLDAAGRLELPERSEPGAWAGLFSDWLRSFGWPGDRPQSSQDFQIVAAWREQLSSFAALGAVQDRWSLGEALRKLASLARTRVLQFHDDQAPLQVMGASEAAGLWFDKLWLADMRDAVWPPPPQPDPFIPVPLQKTCGMPEASAEGVLRRTRLRTGNLCAGAGAVRVSFAAREGETPAALSPMFSPGSREKSGSDGVYPGRTAQLLATGPSLEYIDDQRAPPLIGDTLEGGVSLIADQARCPFRALAHHRLRARELPEVVPGLSPAERGSLVHRIAQALWEQLGDRETLQSTDTAALRNLVAQCVAGILEKRYADSPFQKRFLEIETQRLNDLFMEWLALEAQRGSFRVRATEHEAQVTLGGVELTVRVDRIDELGDGRRLILDYKTGQLVDNREWIDPRMEEPQLPMYALSVAGQIAGLALARVRRGECALRGVGEGVEGVPGLKPVSALGFADMAALESRWRPLLDGLVREHCRGVADVAPKRRDTCRLCDAMSLCRIFERGDVFDD